MICLLYFSAEDFLRMGSFCWSPESLLALKMQVACVSEVNNTAGKVALVIFTVCKKGSVMPEIWK